MRRKLISQQSLILSILTLITVLCWGGFDIYRSYTKTAVKPDVRKQLTPINPKLELDVIKELETLRLIPREEIIDIPFDLAEIEETEVEKVEVENEEATEEAEIS